MLLIITTFCYTETNPSHLTAQKLIAEAQNRHDLQEVGSLQCILEITHVKVDFRCVDEVYDVL